jgi:hypothetical protein
MRRIALGLSLAALLAMPASAFAFHHRDLPSTDCAAEAAGSPSNDNGMAKESLIAHNPTGLPLPPLGSPGNSGMTTTPGLTQTQGGANCANGGL